MSSLLDPSRMEKRTQVGIVTLTVHPGPVYGSWVCDLLSMDPAMLNRCCEEIMAGVSRSGDHH